MEAILMPRSTTADLTVSGGETACMHLDTTAKFFRALSD
ncbi:ArsR family transcriptional regulator, partial [Rhodococcus erythropolis]